MATILRGRDGDKAKEETQAPQERSRAEAKEAKARREGSAGYRAKPFPSRERTSLGWSRRCSKHGAIMVDLAGKALAIFDRTEVAPDDLVPGVADRRRSGVERRRARWPRRPDPETAPVKTRSQGWKPTLKDGTLVDALVTGVIKGGTSR